MTSPLKRLRREKRWKKERKLRSAIRLFLPPKTDPSNQPPRDKERRRAREAFESMYPDGKSLPAYLEAWPKFDVQELEFGSLLGTGSFGHVVEIRGLSLQLLNNDAIPVEEPSILKKLEYEKIEPKDSSRQFLASNCLREESQEARYAVKFLKPNIVVDPKTFSSASFDFAVETRILAKVTHPNIVKLRATALGGLFQERYFIVMDRLYRTLDKEIDKWARKWRRLSSPVSLLVDPLGKKRAKSWNQRILIAFDIGAAMSYLHEHRIIWRDAKPENIGFDVRGDVKLFDFGLAAEWKESDRPSHDGYYHFTSMVGSPRYMAPEVAMGEQYNEKCDSYSFALLLWELLELERPFSSFKTLSDMELVWNAPCTRPVLNKCWSEEIQVLLKQAWTHDVRKRLSMKQIMEKLHKESLQAAGGDASRLEQQRRRSTNVFNPKQQGRRASSASISVPSRRSSVSRRSHRRSSQSGNLSAAITTSPRSNLSDERTLSNDTKNPTQPSGVELAAHLFNELTSLDESIHHHASPSQHCQVQHHKSVPLDPMKEDTSCSETVAEATESSVSGESPGPNRSDERPPQLIKKEQQLLERLQDIEQILVSEHDPNETQNQTSESFVPRFVPSYKAFLDSKVLNSKA